jgi:hypothetical protein
LRECEVWNRISNKNIDEDRQKRGNAPLLCMFPSKHGIPIRACHMDPIAMDGIFEKSKREEPVGLDADQ